jgi:alanyl-tRNA synthetase
LSTIVFKALIPVKHQNSINDNFRKKFDPFQIYPVNKYSRTAINGCGGGRPQQAQGGGPQAKKLVEALEGAEVMLFEMINSL